MTEGSCRLGLWYVQVAWSNTVIHRIRFLKSAADGPVPEEITRFLAGRTMTLDPLECLIEEPDSLYGTIYQAVMQIPYGSVRTYGEIARKAETTPRVVGMAMKRNKTPIIIPCHRVVAADGLGGYTPDIWIKQELLRIEADTIRKLQKKGNYFMEIE